jgi:hypothetical protein
MTRSIRPSTPSDAAAIVSLFAERGLKPNARPEDLHWKYWEPRSDWLAPRSYVLTSDGRIVGHAALIPGAIVQNGYRLTTAHVIDWVAQKGQMGAGVALMKHIGQQADALLAFGGSEDTLRILPHIGFRKLGSVVGYARPLFPSRILTSDRRFSVRLLMRLAKSLAWKALSPSPDGGSWGVRAVENDAERASLSGCLPEPVDGNAILERSPALFRYLHSCTIAESVLYAIEGGEVASGYFVLSKVPGQVRVIDWWMNSRDQADWRAMLNHAISHAATNLNAAEVVLWASGDLQRSVAQSCGFRPRFELPIQIRVSTRAPVDSAPANVQMLDNDAAYLHEDTVSHWI